MIRQVKLIVGVVACLIGTASLANADMTAYYDYNHVMGETILVDSVGGANATIGQGGVFLESQAGVTGMGFGNAVLFTGGNYATMDVLDVFNFARNNFTITGWIKVPNVGTCSTQPYAMVIEAGTHNVSGLNVWVGPCSKGNRGRLGFDVKGPDTTLDNVTLTSDNRIDDNVWHWFALICENVTMYMYIDGVEQFNSGFISYGPTTTGVPPVTQIAFGRTWIGMLDDLKVFNTALTRTVDANYTLDSGELYDVWRSIPPVADCPDAIANGYGYAADLNSDCRINLGDLTMLASEWLNCNVPGEVGCDTPWMN